MALWYKVVKSSLFLLVVVGVSSSQNAANIHNYLATDECGKLKTFDYSYDKVPYAEARNQCKAKGMELALPRVSSQQKESLLRNIFPEERRNGKYDRKLLK